MENIYFIQEENDGPIKIGKTGELTIQARLSALQCGNYRRLKCLLFLKNGKYTEEELHQKFAKDRISGEWFRPSPELLKLISDNQYKIDLNEYKCGPWTMQEMDFVRTNLTSMTATEISKIINRSPMAIRNKKKELKFGKERVQKIIYDNKKYGAIVYSERLGAVWLGTATTREAAELLHEKYNKNPDDFQGCFADKEEYLRGV